MCGRLRYRLVECLGGDGKVKVSTLLYCQLSVDWQRSEFHARRRPDKNTGGAKSAGDQYDSTQQVNLRDDNLPAEEINTVKRCHSFQCSTAVEITATTAFLGIGHSCVPWVKLGKLQFRAVAVFDDYTNSPWPREIEHFLARYSDGQSEIRHLHTKSHSPSTNTVYFAALLSRSCLNPSFKLSRLRVPGLLSAVATYTGNVYGGMFCFWWCDDAV